MREGVRNGAGRHASVARRDLVRGTKSNDERRSASDGRGASAGMANKVSLERGEPLQRETLANLVQLYIHDFSEFLSAQRKLAVEEDGRFADLLTCDH